MILEERAIQACVEYDTVKRKIDEATSTIASCFESCEERQREEINESDFDDVFAYNDAMHSVEPCLQFLPSNSGVFADWDCDDCEQALKVIRKRKQLRQDFGVAKRKIRSVARAKYKMEG